MSDFNKSKKSFPLRHGKKSGERVSRCQSVDPSFRYNHIHKKFNSKLHFIITVYQCRAFFWANRPRLGLGGESSKPVWGEYAAVGQIPQIPLGPITVMMIDMAMVAPSSFHFHFISQNMDNLFWAPVGDPKLVPRPTI
jgi:hypothetical protein